MAKKLNIEDIKQLIPDYITGSLSGEEFVSVDNAIKSNPEIASLYSDMKSALEFVENVKFEEPIPQYWNNLLPKIHEKIEARNEKKLFKNPIPLIWKILVPVAAIILIAVIYRIATTPENQITKENIPNIQNEKPMEQQNPLAEQQKPIDTVTKAENENNDEQTEKKQHRQYKVESKEENNNIIAEQENKEAEQKGNNILEQLSSEDINELSEINSVDANSRDEDLDNEIQNLSSSDKEALLQELKNSDL